MAKKIKQINWDSLKSVGEVQHLKMSSAAFNDVLRLIKIGYSWADLCEVGGGVGVIHSVAWYVDRHESAGEALADAVASGASWRAVKLDNDINSVKLIDDSAAKVARDKLRLTTLQGQKNEGVKALGEGIGNAIIEAQRRAAGLVEAVNVLDITPTAVNVGHDALDVEYSNIEDEAGSRTKLKGK